MRDAMSLSRIRTFRVWPVAAGLALVLTSMVLAGCSQAPAASSTAEQAAATVSQGAAQASAGDQVEPPDGLSEEELAEFRRKHPDAAAVMDVAERRRKLAMEALGEEYVPFEDKPHLPPDGRWLIDDEGRQYFVDKIKKYPGKFQMISEERVNLYGVKVDIIGHDDDWFYTKSYRATGEPLDLSYKPPTAEEIAAVDATYEGSPEEVDRIRFEPFDEGLPTGGQWRNGFDIGDMNEDGQLDIVHAPPRKSGDLPVILLGDGAGSWTPWSEARYQAGYDYGDAAVADFNGDGHLDIALGIHLRGVKILVGNGVGGFSEWSRGIDYQIPGRGGDGNGFSSRRVMPLDWNGDGLTDLLALGEGPRVGSPQGLRDSQRAKRATRTLFVADGPAIFLNQGDGSWVKEQKAVGPYEIFGDDLALGDFNGDGRTDFATSSSRMSRRDLINLAPAEGLSWEAVNEPLVRPFAFVRSVVAADFDGNGLDDLAVSYTAFETDLWRSGIDILYSMEGGETERRPLFYRKRRLGIFALDQGDLNGDGAIDLVGVDGDGDGYVFLGDGEGFFVREASPELDKPRGRCRGYRVRLVDLDGDGRDEAIASYADEASAYFDPDRCLTGGGMMAWTNTDRTR